MKCSMSSRIWIFARSAVVSNSLLNAAPCSASRVSRELSSRSISDDTWGSGCSGGANRTSIIGVVSSGAELATPAWTDKKINPNEKRMLMKC